MVLGAVLLWLCKVWNLAHFDSIFSNCCRNVLNSDERRLSSQLDHRKATNVMNHANDVIAKTYQHGITLRSPYPCPLASTRAPSAGHERAVRADVGR